MADIVSSKCDSDWRAGPSIINWHMALITRKLPRTGLANLVIQVGQLDGAECSRFNSSYRKASYPTALCVGSPELGVKTKA